MNTRKPNTKNISIRARVTLAAVAGLVLAIVLSIIVIGFFRTFLPKYYNIVNVTTNSYSLINQIQWNQAMSSITDELTCQDSDEEKQQKIDAYASSLGALDTQIYISKNGEDFYSNESPDTVFSTASSIIKIDPTKNINYFGENGLVILSHIERQDSYVILVADDDYTVSNNSAQDIAALVFSRTGLIILTFFLILVLSIILMSIITSRTITKPIKMLSDGANEIANGNLDFAIDYDSTNEIGITVKSMNEMTIRLKESISQRDKLEESRKEMIAGVAHDLRTPLTSVKGYVEGLRDGIANTQEKQEQYLETIYASTISMEKLLDELLTISRLERGKIQLEPEPVILRDFLSEYIEDMGLRVDRYGIELIFDKEKVSDDVIVNIDCDRFSRVLTNIVSNSVRYASKARAPKLDISVQAYDKSVIISLADNGIGISKENLGNIFDAFFRADQARTRVSNGSGLGLAVCKEIVELHSGRIWATSSEGEGTTIHISLERLLEE